MQQIRVFLDDQNTLVAEAGGDLIYKEIFVGIEKSDGTWIDLCVVGEGYRYADNEKGIADVIANKSEYTIKVFDPQNYCDMITETTVYDYDAYDTE